MKNIIKKDMQRGILLFLVFTLFMSLVACGKKSKKEENEKEKASEELDTEVPPVSIDGLLYGVVMETDEKGLTVQSDRGEAVYIRLKKELRDSLLSDGIKPGKAIKIKYSGDLDLFGTDAETITDADRIPKLPEDALKAAAEVVLAFRRQDGEKLKELCRYPLLIDRGKKESIKSPKGLTALNEEELFSEKLVTSVTETNLFLTNLYENGLILGRSKPNLIMQKGKKGWEVTAIHYK